MCYIFIHMDHLWHLVHSNVMISFGNPAIISDFRSVFFQPNCRLAVSRATGMYMDERSVDCLVLCSNNQARKVSAKSVTAWHNFKWLQRFALFPL